MTCRDHRPLKVKHLTEMTFGGRAITEIVLNLMKQNDC
jgi:hypothetical protein